MRPPRLVTMAAVVFITGSQSGVVVSATSLARLELGEVARVGDARARHTGDGHRPRVRALTSPLPSSTNSSICVGLRRRGAVPAAPARWGKDRPAVWVYSTSIGQAIVILDLDRGAGEPSTSASLRQKRADPPSASASSPPARACGRWRRPSAPACRPACGSARWEPCRWSACARRTRRGRPPLHHVLAQAPGAGDEHHVGWPDSVSIVNITPLEARSLRTICITATER